MDWSLSRCVLRTRNYPTCFNVMAIKVIQSPSLTKACVCKRQVESLSEMLVGEAMRLEEASRQHDNLLDCSSIGDLAKICARLRLEFGSWPLSADHAARPHPQFAPLPLTPSQHHHTFILTGLCSSCFSLSPSRNHTGKHFTPLLLVTRRRTRTERSGIE